MSTKSQRGEGAAENLARLLTSYGRELDQDTITLSVLSFINDVNERLDEHDRRFNEDAAQKSADQQERQKIMALLWGDTQLNLEGIGAQVAQTRAHMERLIVQQERMPMKLDKLSEQQQAQWRQLRVLSITTAVLGVFVFLELMAIVWVVSRILTAT